MPAGSPIRVPPRVVYQLTPAGQRLDVVFAATAAWADKDLPALTELGPI
jgi:DNA-binding HxlR family transcriptional regulator